MDNNIILKVCAHSILLMWRMYGKYNLLYMMWIFMALNHKFVGLLSLHLLKTKRRMGSYFRVWLMSKLFGTWVFWDCIWFWEKNLTTVKLRKTLIFHGQKLKMKRMKKYTLSFMILWELILEIGWNWKICWNMKCFWALQLVLVILSFLMKSLSMMRANYWKKNQKLS